MDQPRRSSGRRHLLKAYQRGTCKHVTRSQQLPVSQVTPTTDNPHSRIAVALFAGTRAELPHEKDVQAVAVDNRRSKFSLCLSGQTHIIQPAEFSFDRLSQRDDCHYCCLHSQLREKRSLATPPVNSLSTASNGRSLRLYAAQVRR